MSSGITKQAATDPLVPKYSPFAYNVGVNYESWEVGRTGYSIKADLNQISDNFKSRLGRRHPFMYAAALPVSIAFFMLWNPPQGLSDGQLVAYLLSCLLTVRLFGEYAAEPGMTLHATPQPGRLYRFDGDGRAVK